jgi:hypothetical protein
LADSNGRLEFVSAAPLGYWPGLTEQTGTPDILHSAAILNRSLDPDRIARTATASLAGAAALQYEREELT